MKKHLLLIATALLTLSGHANAADNEGQKNAVCVSLKSGQTEFVAFTSKPQIKADGGKLYVVSTDDQQQLLIADLSNVEKITATSHDFTAIGKVTVEGNTTEEIVNVKLLADAIGMFLRLQSDEARNLFIGRYYYLDSLKEAAAYCGMSESKAKSLLFRTRIALKEYLEKEGFSL